MMNHIVALVTLASVSLSSSLAYREKAVAPKENPAPIAIEVQAAPEPVTYTVKATAYSSTPEETDDTPFITATGRRVRDGIIAANFLPFGTKVMIPEHFGEKVFVVDDRMHSRKKNWIDVWMPSKAQALKFGFDPETEIVIVEDLEKPIIVAGK